MGEDSAADVADGEEMGPAFPLPFFSALALFVVAVAFTLAAPLVSAGLMVLGLVIGMADLCTVRDAIALALARWCGERAERII